MKKYMTIIFLFLFNVLYSIPESIQSAFPTFKWQIENNIGEGIDKNELLAKLRTYLQNPDAEMLKGLKMVLFESEYRDIALFHPQQFNVDGNDTEWQNVRFRLEDSSGNVSIPNADLIDFRCFLSPDLTLYVMHKTFAKPRQTQGEENFGLDIRINNVNITIKYGIDGVKTECKLGRKTIPIEINWKVNNIAEAGIPLGRILKLANINTFDNMRVRGYVEHRQIGQVVKRSGRHTQRFNNQDATADYLYLPGKRVNYALELFLHLVNKDCFQEGDSITFALALANNWLYSIATPDARIAIKEDIVKHYHYYLKINKWQETLPIHIRLKKSPLLPKLFWANRYIYMDNTRKMTLNDYREFIDTMETLEGFHKIILENKLHTGYRFKTIAGKIISFGTKHNIYRGYIDRYISSNTLHKLKPDVLRDYNAGEYETFYYGRKRKWMFYKWMNFQYKRYRQTGFTRGDCITFSRVQAALFKACGIPASWAYRVTYFTPSTSDHLFVLYYNSFQNKWDQHDYSFKRDVKTKLKFAMIRWHHLLKNFRDEKVYMTTNSKKNALFKRGIENWLLDDLVFNHNPQITINMFENPNVPSSINDSDGDGIWDEIETKLGLNSQNPDSDNDGYSDLWELEHGYNPLDSNSPGRLNFPVIDGIADNSHLTNNVVSVTSDEGNYSAYEQIYNVKSVFARIIKNELFLTVIFYNDIRKNGSPYHTFKIVSAGSSRDSYSLLLTKKIFFKKGREKLAVSGIEYASINTLNVVIPLQYFTGAASLSITYHGYGKKGRKKSASAKRSKVLNIQL